MRKLFFLVAFLLFTQIGFAWWSDGNNWTLRKPITINGSTSSLSDYQVKIELNWTSGMNATCSDFRFTDNSTNGVLLPHWTENCTASVNATVWVKANLTTGNNTVYVYYNNPTALSAGNASSTFTKSFGANDLQGEWQMDAGSGTQTNDTSGNNKNGLLLGGTSWINNDGGFIANNPSLRFESGSTVKFSSVGDAINIGNMTNLYSGNIRGTENFTIMFWLNATSVNQYANPFDSYYKPGVYPNTLIRAEFNHLAPSDKLIFTTRNPDTYIHVYTTSLPPTNIWMFVALTKNKTTFKSYLNGSIIETVTGSNNITFENLTFGTGLGDNPTVRQFYGSIDSVQIFNRTFSNMEITAAYERRKYASPEPVVLSVGAEEGMVVTLQSPQNKTYNTASIDLNFTLSNNASSCLYELDGVNTTITGCQNTSISVPEGYFNYSQEFAEASTTDFGSNAPIDGDWSTPYNPPINGSTGYIWSNYTTYRNYSLNTSTVELKYRLRITDTPSYLNISIPASCWATTKVDIRIEAYNFWAFCGGACKSSLNLTCNTGTTLTQMWYAQATGGTTSNLRAEVYEERMNWITRLHQIKVWANDSANNWGVSSTVSFTVDTTLPSATIQLPVNATYNKLNGSVTLNFTTSDNFGVSQCKYELDGVNTSLPTCSNATLTLTDGSHRIKVWVNDTANNWNSTPLIYFISDFTEPTINIQSPTNSTYNISTVALNFTIGESVGLSTCKYELDGINTTISCTANTTITGLSHGGHSIKIWANDTAGNTNNSATISFSNDIVLYVYVYDETTPSQNVTFNLTISNSTASKTANNQVYYTGNFTADPRGSLTLTLSAAGYNSRTFYTTWDGTAKVNYTAYLLTGTNQYTFYIKNANSVAIEGAVVTIKRSINNVLQTVGEATTDTAGTVLFTLTPNIVYTVQVVASNYNTHTGTILPTQASYTYTITLSSSTSTPNFQQVWNGVRYTYQPAFTILKNAVNTFNFTIYSIVDGLTSYGMNISINGTIVSSQTGNTTTGGSISATVDLRNYTTEAGYARLWFTKTGMPTQVIQPDKNFNVYTNPTSNISAAAIALNFGNTAGITEQTKFMISVIISIIMMAVTAGFGAGRNGSAIIGLLVLGAFVWVGWVPALYLTFGILFVFGILIIKGAY